MTQVNWQDSRWAECSASLRKGTLYVKMPRTKVVLLAEALSAENQDLLLKEVLESEKSFVFYGSTDDWNEDLITLKRLGSSDFVRETPSLVGVVQGLVLAIEAGLRNEAQVDWISRVRGPRREEADALESLFEGGPSILDLP